MNLTKALTPKDTEEVKPGLFIQKKYGIKGKESYRQIHPAAWNGKINYKNLIFGPNFWRNFLWFIILLLLIGAYWNDTNELREFQQTVNTHKLAWCAGVPYEELRSDNESFTPIQNNFRRIT